MTSKRDFLTEATRNLLLVEAALTRVPEPRWDLIGRLKSLEEECRMIQELGEKANTAAIAKLLREVTATLVLAVLPGDKRD